MWKNPNTYYIWMTPNSKNCNNAIILTDIATLLRWFKVSITPIGRAYLGKLFYRTAAVAGRHEDDLGVSWMVLVSDDGCWDYSGSVAPSFHISHFMINLA